MGEVARSRSDRGLRHKNTSAGARPVASTIRTPHATSRANRSPRSSPSATSGRQDCGPQSLTSHAGFDLVSKAARVTNRAGDSHSVENVTGAGAIAIGLCEGSPQAPSVEAAARARANPRTGALRTGRLSLHIQAESKPLQADRPSPCRKAFRTGEFSSYWCCTANPLPCRRSWSHRG